MQARRWCVLAVALVAACGVEATESESQSAVKTPTGVCHATGSSSSPFVSIAGNGAGHEAHAGDYPDLGLGCPATFALTTFTFGNGAFGSGGTITAVPDVGVLCPGCTVDVRAGTTVTLAAVPWPGWTFDGWVSGCAGTGPCTIQMSSAWTVAAQFSAGPTTLTIEMIGRGQVQRLVNPFPPFVFETICTGAGPCTYTAPAGSAVLLWGVGDPGYVFDGFTGACTGPFNCFIALDADKTVTAHFSEIPPPPPTCFVTVRANGPGAIADPDGGVWVDGTWAGGEEFTFATTCDEGSPLTFLAAPHADAVFTGWSGDCAGADPGCTLPSGGDRTFIASFASSP